MKEVFQLAGWKPLPDHGGDEGRDEWFTGEQISAGLGMRLNKGCRLNMESISQSPDVLKIH